MKEVLVLGSGAMGSQIAFYIASKGISTKIFDVSGENLESAENKLNQLIEKGRQPDTIKGRISFTKELEYKQLKNVELVIEAVIENKNIKNELFKEISKKVNENCIITSNSSSIVSSELLEGVNHSERICNLHFFNPVHKMALVEIVKGEHTSDETVDKLESFVAEIDKEFVLIEKEILGFLVNRVLASIIDEALYLYEGGYASFEDIDKAVKLGLNHPMGPFELLDYTGIDINYDIKNLFYEQENDEKRKPTKSLIELYNAGRLGIKTGGGYYDYK